MIILVEIAQIPLRGRKWFYFLNFFWGRALFSLFIALFLLGSGASLRWLDILLAVYFFIMAAVFLGAHFLYRTAEPDNVKILIDAMEAKIEEKAKAAEGKNNKANNLK